MKKNDVLLIGLMLFSMFFGAGNLMFPPFLGAEAGSSFWIAMAGFIATGVGLPVIVLAAISLVRGGAEALADRVHPLFSTVFIAIVYLSIGPFLAIPRNATVAFEMSLKPFMNSSSTLSLLLFSLVFFGLVYVVSLNESKMMDYMGRWITPALLLSILVLSVVAFIRLNSGFAAPVERMQEGAFFKGFLDGYATMDALASLAFGIVIISALKQKGISDRKSVFRYTLSIGLIAGAALAFVYIVLGVMGAKMVAFGSYTNGTEILSASASLLFGSAGSILLGIIFTLACFTTCVGLTTACGQYFSKVWPRVSYKTVVVVVTLVSLGLANLGLNQILTVSVPFLVMAYPLTIVLVVLAFLHPLFKGSHSVYVGAMTMTGLVALYEGIKATGLSFGVVDEMMNLLPFASYSLGWILPAIVGGITGYLMTSKQRINTPRQKAA
ncbi:branched-chain amino acid transport system II carrier protein [Bacillus sp. HMF5848]|uniref:branched-chain amino acid transport system II carrier protein n=1 Tax=Bacillus sp. HMF5848 TaxID=2495421 RepID=UPI000F7ADE07|nr:branched-chain amino acid transport system II carrier protein [Bacillus sp. HMF5848]RSK29470.1 branched-chain amino acid transport system II carrier protein [Bacillus sp. HMF5848]